MAVLSCMAAWGLIMAADTDAAKWTPTMIATVIVGVLVSTAFLALTMWLVCRSAERAERDLKYRRRTLLFVAMLYGGFAAFGIVSVATGEEPISSLIGLPIAAAFVWAYLRAARKVKVPPQ
jgi:hypothetical protein